MGYQKKRDAGSAIAEPAAKRARGEADGDEFTSSETASSRDTGPGPSGGGESTAFDAGASSPPWGAIADDDVPLPGSDKGKGRALPVPDTTSIPTAPVPPGHKETSMSDLALPPGVPAGLIERIHALVDYRDGQRDIYSVKHVPSSLQWASIMLNPKNRYLCRPGTKRAVTIWVPGVVSKLWLFDLSGNPHSNAAVTVSPFSSRDAVGLRNLVSHYSTSTNVAANPDEVRASCWQSRSVVAFDHLYDATRVLRAKPQMMRLPAEELHEGDLVLHEFTITRYNEKGTDKHASDKYRATFEMQAVYLLLRGDDAGEEVVEDAGNFSI
ncbi:hypothetical protein FA95DRAFT_1577592 [Auriscalpium vulgare]|uniref:Uncharacterized protein n=1 Tax=Auriscalpium vulgare TaxID=40419 RepID=A0ACB8R5S4_9AGAM|nr:hypothetical protein FA95DRAFT_1577592 [Auriscalpium vulgare]